MEKHLISYYIGILIIFFTHFIIVVNPSLKLMDMKMHSYINIIGAMGIAYYFMYKENYIKF